MPDFITIRGARLHNLQNVSLAIPKNQLVVFTGLSGSGKSTLVFDTLHKEGQRQYMESLGMVSYALSKAQVDSIEGLSPSIAVDQRLSNRSPRSTVGTTSEVYTYLRVLYARLGHRPCPSCGGDVPPSHDVNSSETWDDEAAGLGAAPDADEDEEERYPCPHCGAPVPEMSMGHFSFNKPAGACPTCTGLGTAHQVNLDAVIDAERSIQDGAVHGWDRFFIARYAEALEAAGRFYGFEFDAGLPVGELGPVQRDLLLYGVRGEPFRRHFPGIKPPDTVGQGNFEGVVTNLQRRFAEHAHDPDYREKMEGVTAPGPKRCPDCEGTRLRPEARRVTVAGQNIVDLQRLPLAELAQWLARLDEVVPAEEWAIAAPIVDDLGGRVQRLVDVGVGYLALERASPTLAAGEAQRLRLASLLGSGLTGVLYVLDEPTIGLHPRDTARLIQVLRRLRDLGNTVLVIEHDLEMLAAADHVVDIGPGAGRGGGRVVVAGPPAAVAACADSVTGGHLSGRLAVPVPAARRPVRRGGSRSAAEFCGLCPLSPCPSENGAPTGGCPYNSGPPGPPDGGAASPSLLMRGAREHNLKNVTVRLPLGRFVAVSGVSGSGKSSLLFDVLDRAARQRFYGAGEPPGEHDGIDGWEHLDKVVTIDQSAIGRSPRSNAATYTETFTPIREAFAATPEARRLGLSARHFSFNVPGGRCERCEGAGVLTVEMHFLPDVQVRCPACHGRRFKREVLAAKLHGYSITELLALTIEEALPLFQDVPAAAARLGVMVEAGLGYLQLGQPVTTLSGGEAQRVKLARELGRRATGRTLYLLDEPTTGLHPADVARLLAVLQRLVDAGNTVVVVEHNLDVIRAADWVIDLGPEGGHAGGYVVAEGTPEQVALVEGSATGAFLRAW